MNDELMLLLERMCPEAMEFLNKERQHNSKMYQQYAKRIEQLEAKLARSDRKEIEAVYRKLGELEAKHQWQPIETAPRDGRRLILLYGPSRFPQVAYSNTWWTAGFSAENKPTHWMPLPKPPENQHEL